MITINKTVFSKNDFNPKKQNLKNSTFFNYITPFPNEKLTNVISSMPTKFCKSSMTLHSPFTHHVHKRLIPPHTVFEVH